MKNCTTLVFYDLLYFSFSICNYSAFFVPEGRLMVAGGFNPRYECPPLSASRSDAMGIMMLLSRP